MREQQLRNNGKKEMKKGNEKENKGNGQDDEDPKQETTRGNDKIKSFAIEAHTCTISRLLQELVVLLGTHWKDLEGTHMESIGKAKSGILFAISNFDIRHITFTFAAEKNARPSGPNPLILSIDLQECGIRPTTTRMHSGPGGLEFFITLGTFAIILGKFFLGS